MEGRRPRCGDSWLMGKVAVGVMSTCCAVSLGSVCVETQRGKITGHQRLSWYCDCRPSGQEGRDEASHKRHVRA